MTCNKGFTPINIRAYTKKFQIADYWIELAEKYDIAFPGTRPHASLSECQRYMRLLGLTDNKLKRALDVEGITGFLKLNPTFPLFAVIGVLMEAKEALAAEKTQNKATLKAAA